MKRLIIISGLISTVFCSLSQTQMGFNYQASIQGVNGEVITNQPVTMRFTLLGSDGQTVFYKEEQSTVTNNHGIVSLRIGEGNVLEGDFSLVPWSTQTIHLKVELQVNGGSYVSLGLSPIATVPYALFAFSGNEGPQGPIGPQGPVGPEGPVGPQGPAGADGRTILHGTVNPSNAIGSDGDFYINTSTNMLFGPKASGTWPAGVSLVGPQGQPGISIQWLGTFPAHPLNPSTNQAYYNSVQKKSYIYSGGAWQIMTQDGADAVAAVTGTGTIGKLALWSGTQSLTSLPLMDVSPNLSISSNPSASDDDPILEVKNKQGQVVFAVYQKGVRVYVSDDGSKSVKGGFAIGGLSTGKTDDTLFMKVTPDSVRILFRENATKSVKGGFAVGGLSSGKGKYSLLEINPDSTRIFFKQSSTKSIKGGFAVGGLSSGKTEADNIMNITPENYLIGFEAGMLLTTGLYNSFLGYQAGKSTSIGNWNTFLGYQAGLSNLGSDNTFIGYMAGKSHTNKGGNVYIGSKAGALALDGEQNVSIGESAGYKNSGSKNIMIGFESGYNTVTGGKNIFMGVQSGFNNSSGNNNIVLGEKAGYNLTTGNHNLIIGNSAGYNHTNQEYNIMLGTCAGYSLSSLGWSGSFNTFIGINSGYKITSSKENVFVGTNSGFMLEQGNSNTMVGIDAGRGGDDNLTYYGYITNRNTFIGCQAGRNLLNGDGNVFLGYQAGYNETNTSNKLYIENSTNSTTPLIHGDFLSDRVAINRKADTYPFQVGTSTSNGNGAYLTPGGVWTNASSRSFKDRFESIDKTELFSKIEQLDVKYWYFVGTQERHVGPVAEDFYKLFGTGVLDEPNYLGKSLSAMDVAGISLGAVKELIQENKTLKEELEKLRKELSEIREILGQR